MVFVSQLERIGRIRSGYEQLCERHYKLTQKLINRYAELCKAQKPICMANTTEDQ